MREYGKIKYLCTVYSCLLMLIFSKGRRSWLFPIRAAEEALLSLGRIQDSAGTWYDIWICPGYVPPARYARRTLKEAGDRLPRVHRSQQVPIAERGQ